MKNGIRPLVVSAVCVLAFLVVIRFVGSPLVTRRVNAKLDNLPDFKGHVETVQLALWRGTVGVRDFQLISREAPGDGPLVHVDHATLSIAWLPLLKGKLGGHGVVNGADVLMVKKVAEKPSKNPKTEKPPVREWQRILREAFPIEITRLEVKNARARFEDRSVQPMAIMAVDQLHVLATDLSNRPKGTEEMPAKVQLDARVGGSGRLSVDTRADPSAAQPRFLVKMDLQGLSLPGIHDFLLAYALIDVAAGTFDVYSEVEASGGRYQGYIKPFFKDLQFKAVPDPNKNVLQRAATKVASSVTGLLKNEQGDVATKAPFKGDFKDNQVDVWTTIENLLRNAFVQGLREGLEGQTETAR